MVPINPFFSIIIPTYNSDKTLGRCLDSILAQRFPNFEIIIVDGLSCDRTIEVAKKNNDPRIKVFSEKDRGVYDAMNKGIDLARGDWILFLGADDQLFDDLVLTDAHNCLIKTKAELVYGNIQMFGNNSLGNDGDIYDGEFSLCKLFSKNICHQSIFYSKKLFSKVGYYDTTYPVLADWDLNLRCFAGSAVQYHDKIITLFSAGGLSGRMGDNFTLGVRCRKIKEYFGYGVLDSHYKAVKDIFLNEAAALYIRNEPLEAFRYWIIYFYHTKNKIQALKQVAVKMLSRAYNNRRKR